ncbi:glycosyltransferase family 61 protein [Cobetia sp. UIB-001]|uniref:glycosyltransferase family 61 protein n=1 Tax=Cobetia sp. UIB-001 TaxID=2717697 RepID=UPI00384BFB20
MPTIVYPYLAKVDDGKIVGWHGGFDNKKDFYKFGLKRPNAIFGEMALKPISQAKNNKVGENVYCGVMFPYFGHFILETLSCLPYVQPEDNLVFSNLGKGDILDWQKEILTFIGIADRVLLVNKEPVEFDSLKHVPQASIINSYIGKDLIEYASKINSCNVLMDEDNYKKIYLSRSKVKNANSVEELKLEEYFKSIGFKIIYPEKISFKEQVEIYRRANTIVSIEGSALHTLIFTSHKLKLYVIPRRKELAHNFLLQFFMQNNICLNILSDFSGNAANFSAKPQLDTEAIIDYFEGELQCQ